MKRQGDDRIKDKFCNPNSEIRNRTTILNVDDDETSRYTISHILHQAGFEVMEAASGAEALRLLKENPDLVILDVHLPDINGLEVCRRIRADPATSLMPVLMLSATYRDDQSRVKGLDSGADGYLTHPVEPQVLISTVKALLRIRQAEAELQAAAREWRTTFDAIGDAVSLLDLQGSILRCNQAMTDLLGKPFNEITGRTCWELVHGTSEPIEGCPIVRMRETHRRETLVLPMGDRWLEVAADPLLDEDGYLIGSVHIMADITERKRAEEALRESEARFREVFDKVSEILFTIHVLDDGCFRIGMFNEAEEKAIGVRREEGEGKLLEEVFPAEMAQAFAANYRRCLEAGAPISYEEEGDLLTGHRFFYTTLSPVRDEAGRIHRIIGSARDITQIKLAEAERKRAEEVLQRSGRELSIRNRIAEIFLTTPDDEMYGEILRVVLEVTESKYGLFGYIGEDGALVCPSMTREVWDRCQIPDKDIVFPRQTWGGLWGYALIDKKSLYSNKPLRVPEGHIPILRALDVPIIHRREVIGNLLVGNKATDYDKEDCALLEAIAKYIAPILHARLQEDREGRKRKRAETELSALVERDEALVQALGEIVYDWRPLSGELFWDGAYTRILGYPPEEMGGDTESWTSRVHPDDLERVVAEVDDATRERRCYDLEYRFRDKDGSYHWMHDRGVTFVNEQGVLERIIGVFSNITERKQAEEALRERLKELTCLYAVHRNMQENLPTDELCRRVVEHLVSAMEFPEIAVPVIELDGRRFTSEGYTKGLSHGLHAQIRVEGEARGHLWVYYAEDRPFLIPEEQNFLNGIAEALGVWLEHKRAEEALQESEEKLRVLFEQLPIGVSLLDQNRNMIYANPALEKIWDISRDDLLQGKYQNRRYIRPDETPMPPEEYASVQAFQEQQPVHDVETGVITESGKTIWTSVSAAPFPMADKGVVIATVDITERKRAEEEREWLLAELEAKNRELESFVYTVSHDLKAPLVSLHGFSSTLQKEFYHQLNDEGRHYLERIQANAAHMDTLIMDLLELSRIGRVVGPIEEMDVAALQREIQEELAIKLEEAGAEFVVQEPLPTIRADRGRIHQVFTNLIDNAIKFRSEERLLRIEVGCREERSFYRFHVADNGIGIAPQYQEKIFAPFQQLDPETEGVGMGLALVKKIVEHHGGRVWVESEAEKGATFYFTIPIS